MRRYLIERTIPGAGQMSPSALAEIAAASNEVLRHLGPAVQWVHSYVTDDRIVCVYNADDEDLIREHARCGGFPVDAISQIRTVIDPITAEWAEAGA